MSLFWKTTPKPHRSKSTDLDEKLIFQIGQDDKKAFQEFYENVNPALFAYILSIVQNQQDAEEVLQETYLKIRAAAHLYKPQGKPMAWVFTIARNLSLMRIRQTKRIADQSLDEFENDRSFAVEPHSETKSALKTALTHLDELERSIILLHSVSGYKHREIAEHLSVPLSTIISKYSRSLKKLRVFLER